MKVRGPPGTEPAETPESLRVHQRSAKRCPAVTVVNTTESAAATAAEVRKQQQEKAKTQASAHFSSFH